MSGARDLLVLCTVGLLLVGTILGEDAIADLRRDRDGTPAAGVVEPLPGDRDGDQIPDSLDQCPTSPETFNGFQDQDGCPDVTTRTRAS